MTNGDYGVYAVRVHPSVLFLACLLIISKVQKLENAEKFWLIKGEIQTNICINILYHSPLVMTKYLVTVILKVND